MKRFPCLEHVAGILCATVLFVLAAAVCSGQTITEITLPGELTFPESVTSTADGTLIVGSLGHGNVLRIAPGKTDVVEWIKPGAGGLNDVLGVFADEKAHVLWVCSNRFEKKGEAPALKTYDLNTGAVKASYPLPGDNPLCNDIATAADGTAYVADTVQGALFMLKPGARKLETAAKDPLLAGADGLAFGEKTILYVNSFTKHKLVRVNLGPDGKATSVTELKLSRPLDRPDGMRTIGKNRLLMAENSGKMDIVTFEGDNATIQTIKEGLVGTPAVTATRGMAWILEGKMNYRDPGLKDQDPGPFKLYAVPLPKN